MRQVVKMECPKCGNPRFIFDPRYNCYYCKSCGHEDRVTLTPKEVQELNDFQRKLDHCLGDTQPAKGRPKKDMTFADFENMMKQYIENNRKKIEAENYKQFKKNIESYMKEQEPKQGKKK